MRKVLLLLLMLAISVPAAFAENSAVVDAYGSMQGTITTQTFAVTGTINGLGAQNTIDNAGGLGILSGGYEKTGVGTVTTNTYAVDLHGVTMESGTKLRSAAGVAASSSGPTASASGKVELNQSVSGSQRVDYTCFAPGSYGTQSYSATQSTTIQSSSGNTGQ